MSGVSLLPLPLSPLTQFKQNMKQVQPHKTDLLSEAPVCQLYNKFIFSGVEILVNF